MLELASISSAFGEHEFEQNVESLSAYCKAIARQELTKKAVEKKKQKEKEIRRKAEHDERANLFQTSNSNTLLAMLELSRSKDAERDIQSEGTAIGFLCKSQPEIIKQYVASLKESKSKTKPKAQVRGRSTNGRAMPKTPRPLRSSSKGSKRASSSGSKAPRGDSGQRQQSRGREASKGSKASSSQSKKGKKGKSKGKGGGKGKGKRRK